MLVGIALNQLRWRTRILLAVASLAFVAALLLTLFNLLNAAQQVQTWLLAIVLLGGYWISFLLDTSARLSRPQLLLASAFALLPWTLVLLLVLGYPHLVFGVNP